MPKYQYQCKACGDALEVQQSFTDDALTMCPSCSGDLRKVFNAVGVVFKGSGFYKTDSRSSSTASDTPKPATKESAPAPKTESTPVKKSGADSAA